MKYINSKVFLYIALISLMLTPLGTILKRIEVFTGNSYWKEYASYKSNYENSQYVKKVNPLIIPDEVFESYAGGAFLKGLNPILITHDHPPLGRYLISASIFIFNNQHTIIIPLYFFSMLGIYLITKLIIEDRLLSLIPLVIILNEPLFADKLVYTPLPELIQFPFIIFAIYFFIKSTLTEKKLKYFLITSLLIGFVISTRVFVLGVVMVFSFLGYLAIYDRKKIPFFLLTLPLSLCIMVLSYTKTMIDGASILDVFRIQKYILAYHKSKFILPFSFWDLILFNRWHTWWGEEKIIKDANWVITWPFSLVLSVLFVVLALLKKIRLSRVETIIIFWVFSYMIFLSVGYTSTRYFMPIIPFLYILALSFIVKRFGLIPKK